MKSRNRRIGAAMALILSLLLSSCTAMLDRMPPETEAPTKPPVASQEPGRDPSRETEKSEGITKISLSAVQKPLIYLAPGDKLGGALSLIHRGGASEKDVIAKSSSPDVAHAEPLYVEGQRLIFRTVADSLGRAEIWFETADGSLKTETYTVAVTPHGLASEDTAPVTNPEGGTSAPVTDPPEEDEIRDGMLVLLGVTDGVENGDYARVQIKGRPGVEYDIAVHYSTTVSNAKGLGDKVADEEGLVTWTWRVGANTDAGRHRIVVTGGGEQIVFYFSTHR